MKYFFITFFCIFQLSGLGQNIPRSLSINCYGDTILPFYSNTLVDWDNSAYLQTGLEWKLYPFIQPLKKLEFINIDTVSIKNFSFYFNKYFYSNQDSLISQIVDTFSNENDKLFCIYNFIKDRTFYYYYPENKLNDNHYSFQESHNPMKFLNIYGYGACGAHGTAMARFAALAIKKRQYECEIANLGHVVAEAKGSSSRMVFDTDREAFYKLLDNKHMASLKDMVLDPNIYLRTKLFPNINNYIPYDSSAYSNLYNSRWPIDSDKIYQNILGQIDSNNTSKLEFEIKPLSSVIFYPDSNNSSFHKSLIVGNNDSATDNFYIPLVARTGTINQQIKAGVSINKILDSYTNLSLTNDTINCSSQFSSFVYQSSSPYTIGNGFVKFNLLKKYTNDSILIYFSKDMINWTPLFNSDSINTNTLKTIQLEINHLIKPTIDSACYNYYIKFDIQNSNLSNQMIISNLNFSTIFQFSKFFSPTVIKGQNDIKIYQNGNNHLKVDIDWIDYLENTPPPPPSYPGVPANNSIMSSPNFYFSWQGVTSSDDAIKTYQIQVSERSDFLHPICTNYDRNNYILLSNNPFFKSEYESFFNSNTDYFWRVRSLDTRGAYSNWSNTWKFKVKNIQAPKNVRFELQDNLLDTFILKWDNPPLSDNIVKYYLYRNNRKNIGTSTNKSCLFDSTTNNFYKLDKNNLYTYKYRIVAVSANGIISKPSYNVNHPLLTTISTKYNNQENVMSYFRQKLNLEMMPQNIEAKLPWPIVSGDDRQSFILENSADFTRINDSIFKVKFIGNRLLNCYTKVYDDTVLQFQILFKSSNLFSCATNNTKIFFPLQGPPPFKLTYYKNGNIQTFTTVDTNLNLFVPFGSYFFSFYENGSHSIFPINQFFLAKNYNSTNYSIQKDCDSNKFYVEVVSNGDLPITLYYTKNNLQDSNIIYQNNFRLYIDSGVFYLQKIKNNNNCDLLINKYVYANTKRLNVTFSNLKYNCDSFYYYLDININADLPIIVYFKYNNIDTSIKINSSTKKLILYDGEYNFNYCSDTNQCMQAIDKQFLINNKNLQLLSYNDYYNCNTNKNNIEINIDGNKPFSIYYRLNNTSFYFSDSNNQILINPLNGIFHIDSIVDINNCKIKDPIDKTFYYDTLDILIPPYKYNCDSNKTQLPFALQGNPPFVLNYSFNGNPVIKTINGFSDTLYLNNGTYNFISVTDATGCIKFINQVYNFAFTPLYSTIGTKLYNCDSNKVAIQLTQNGNTPLTYHYTENNINKVFTTTSSVDYLLVGNGNIEITNITDNTGCVRLINDLNNFYYDTLDILIPPYKYNCDSNKTQLPFALQGNPPFVLNYSFNGNPVIKTINSFSDTLYLNNGTYNFISVTDATGCIKFINQVYNFNRQKLNYIVDSTFFNCALNKQELVINMQGELPFYITTKNVMLNIIDTVISNLTSFPIFLDSGIHIINSINDNNCKINLTDTIINNNIIPSAIINYDSIFCDQSGAAINIKINTNSNSNILYYNLNAINNIFQFNSNIISYPLLPGTYWFEKLVDTNGCELKINKLLKIDTIIKYYLGYNTKFNCENDSTLVILNLSNNQKFKLNYENNSILTQLNLDTNSFYVANGTYNFLNLIDTNGCIEQINNSIRIENNKPKYNLDSIKFDCAAEEYSIYANAIGKAPFKLAYISNNKLINEIYNSDLITVTLPGDYIRFVSLLDSNQCLLNIDSFINLPFKFKGDFKISKNELNLITNNIQYPINWYNGNSLIAINQPILENIGNGDYFAQIIDSAGCIVKSNNIVFKYDNSVTVFPNPFENYFYIRSDKAKEYNYKVYDAIGRLISSSNSTNNIEKITTTSFSPSIYVLKVIFEDEILEFKIEKK